MKSDNTQFTLPDGMSYAEFQAMVSQGYFMTDEEVLDRIDAQLEVLLGAA